MAFYDSIPEAAKHLDNVYPNWWKEIDLEKLNMKRDYDCILGQLYGEYQKGCQFLGCGNMTTAFNCYAKKEDWIAEINARRNPIDEEQALSNQIAELQAKLEAIREQKRNPEITVTLRKDEWQQISSLLVVVSCKGSANDQIREKIVQQVESA